ncbi:MAG TPA: hypothetical protein VKV32_04425 [Stellaceae bacterium]|nr:hypothetical protein [Stellaceae bacterium]
MRVIALVGLIAVLAGCSPNYYKPGATAQDLDKDKAACNAQALREAPPAMSAAPFAPSYNNLANANCYGPGFGAVMCNTLNPAGSAVPPATPPIDSNGGKRAALFEACMSERGWSRDKPASDQPSR